MPYFLVLKRHMGADPGDVLLVEGEHLAEAEALAAGGLLQAIPDADEVEEG